MGVYKMSKNKIIDHYGFIKFHLELEDHGTPAVIDYEDTNLRENLIDADEIMIDDKKISISFTYPLSVEVMIECEKEDGFSRMDLFKLIYENYKMFYTEENTEVGDPGTYENLYNRKKSQGKYGIWGHYLEELYIESLSYDKKNKTLHMFIGS